MLETAADRAAYLADFGVSVTGAANFNAIFNHEYVDFGEVVGKKPLLTAAYVSPVSTLANGAVITVNSTPYQVIRIEDDSTGWCSIFIEKTL